MKIGIIGSGMVGQTLATGFSAKGHRVKVGTRDPSGERIQRWMQEAGDAISCGTFAEAASFAELAVFAVAWSGAENAVRLTDPKNLAGKPVIDVSNPYEFSRGKPALALGFTDSAGERVQRWFSSAKVVKALNTVAAPLMIQPQREEGTPDMLIAGNDPIAKGKVSELLGQFGWPCIDLGGIDSSRLLEPLATLWVQYALQTQSSTHAFKVLKR